MPGNRISYAVIALKEEDVEKVINKLKEQRDEADKEKDEQHKVQLDELIKWLIDNKEKIYGGLPEEWKPFYDKKIIDIIKDNSTFLSKTDEIDRLDKNCSNAYILDDARIRIFFIDVFAMYLDKYTKFADKLDYAYKDATNTHCCFLINYLLPTKCQEELEKKYKERWPTLSRAYMNGSLHRIAVRVDDLNNFKNIVKEKYSKQAMYEPLKQDIDEKYGSSKKNPNL